MTPDRWIVRFTRAYRHLAAIGAAVVLCGAAVQSQQNGIDARARAALEEMRAAYKALNAFHIKVNLTARYTGSMSPEDFPLPGPDVLELRMERPNKFFMSASRKTDDGRTLSYRVVSDGMSLWYWRSGPNTFTQAKAPTTLTGMAQLLPDNAIGAVDGNTWEADSIMEWDLLTADFDPVKEFSLPGVTVTLTGPEKLGDAPVRVVRMRSEQMQMEFGIDRYLDLESHLIRGTTLIMRGKHPENGRDFSVVMQSVYEVHNARPRFGPADFVFTPPPGARMVSGR